MSENKHSLSVSQQVSGPGGVITIAAEYQGMLPPPSIVAEYEKLIPGAAREILDMAKKEQAHRHEKELVDLKREEIEQKKRHEFLSDLNRRQANGQRVAYVVLLCVFGLAAYFSANGKNIEALAALLVPLTGLIAVVMKSKKDSE
jgi:uncharacterized membrane protein